MGAARRMMPAPWTKPGAPRVAARPSWIGMPRVVVASHPSSPPPSSRGQASAIPVEAIEPRASVRPPSIPPPILATARPSMPAPSPLIQSSREIELEAEVEALREQVGRLVLELASARARILEECEPEIVRLAMTVAARVVGRELESEPPLVLSWIREGLAVLPGREPPVVAVAPDVASSIPLDVIAAEAASAKVVVDAALRPGTCELREGPSVVPIGASERVAAISDALGVDRESPR